MWGFFVATFLLAPVAVLTAFITYLMFSVGKISYKVLAAFIAVYSLVLLVTGSIPKAVHSYIASWTHVGDFLESGMDTSSIAPVIISILLAQAPISILAGGIVGTIYSWWRYFRRPSWVDMQFRLSPYEVFMKHKNIRDIKSDKNGPADGRTLGINERGAKIVQREKEASAHTFVVGASGSGKTTTLLLGARDAIRRGEGFVFVDMKGSVDVPEILSEYAYRYGRPFYHWTSHDPRKKYTGPSKTGPAFYDPMGRGNPTRRADLIIEGRSWSEEHYKLIIKDYLQKALEIAEGVPAPDNVDSIADIISLLDPMELKKRSLHVVGDPYYDKIIAEINYLTDKRIDKDVVGTLDGMRRQLGILRDSIQGRWLCKDPKGQNDIVLFDVAHAGAVVVFTVDSANYAGNAKLVGSLIIQDLMTVSSELRENKSRYPLNVIIDEFSAIGSDNIIGLIARSRDAGMPVTLSTQSLGDLKAVSTEFMEQLTGIVVSFIIHRANRYEDAVVYAGLVGKEKKQVFNQGVEHTSGILGSIGKGAGTGKGTVSVVEDYIVSPAMIQNLGPGEMYYICKSPNRIEKVDVITEDNKVVLKGDSTAPVETSYKPADGFSSFIPSGEEDKYRVDPSINGKKPLALEKSEPSTYGSGDFENDFKAIPAVKKSDPNRIRDILGRKNFEEVDATPAIVPAESSYDEISVPESPFEDEYITEVEPAPAEYVAKPESKPEVKVEKPSLPSLPPIQKKPSSLPALPPIQTAKAPVKRPVPPVRQREDIDTLTSLPKIERPVKPAGARPIRPQKEGTVALPTIFPSPKKEENTKPFTPSAPKEKPKYGVSDWDDL
jgi:hypothetical protein